MDAYELKYERIAASLRALRPLDRIETEQTGGGVVCLFVYSGAGPVYIAGTANETWGADAYRSVADMEAGDPLPAGVETTVDSREFSPDVVARALHAGIAAHVRTWHASA